MDSYVNIRINGKNLESKSDIECAIMKFDEDLKKYPDDEATIVGKSVLLYKLNKFDESLNCLNQIENIKNTSIIELKAIILMGLKDYKQALKLLNEVLKLDKANISALYYKTECLFQLKCFNEVIDTADIALEFDKDGNSISRSFLEVGDDLNIAEVLYTMDIIKLDYEVIKRIDYNRSLRDENKIKLIIRTELETLEKNKEYTKLKYLYMEWFNKEPSDGENMYKVMNEKLSDEIGIKEKRIYDLIKLSYNKV